jgi:hypothetical protein
MKFGAALLFCSLSLSALFAQSQTSGPPDRSGPTRVAAETAAPPQTARQALLEIITGGSQVAMRHLTIEMQRSLKAKDNKSFVQDLAMFDQMKAEASAAQTFDTGQVLLSLNKPGSNEKFEVHVDSDDLNGDTDNIEISFHQFKDGVEQDLFYTGLLSQFAIGLKKQENIWRLDEISVGIKVPVGDPALLEKISKNMDEGGGMIGAKAGAAGGKSAPQMSADQVVMLLGFSQDAYAQLHPDAGFTCSLAELKAHSFNLDERIFRGEPYNGYKFTLNSCQGKPVESFHIIAEPLSPGTAAKAYCTDATRNVRSSEDGRGATCLASGKPVNAVANDATGIGLDVHTHK